MLEYLKKEVCEIAIRAQNDGLCMHKSGNFSGRDPESGLFVITPSAVDRRYLTPRDMIVMDLEYRVIENLGGHKPSSEVLVHTEIYRTRPDVFAVVHAHSHYATSFSILNKNIPAIVYEVGMLGLKGTEVPIAPYQRPGTTKLAVSVASSLQMADVALMQNHGTIAVGLDINDAYLKSSYLEELALMYYISLTANNFTEPPVVPLEELQGWGYPKEIILD